MGTFALILGIAFVVCSCAFGVYIKTNEAVKYDRLAKFCVLLILFSIGALLVVASFSEIVNPRGKPQAQSEMSENTIYEVVATYDDPHDKHFCLVRELDGEIRFYETDTILSVGYHKVHKNEDRRNRLEEFHTPQQPKPASTTFTDR